MTLIEKMACAIAYTKVGDGEDGASLSELMHAVGRMTGGKIKQEDFDRDCRLLAIAALTAAREPSVSMMVAGTLKGAYPEYMAGWEAAIDAALKERGL